VRVHGLSYAQVGLALGLLLGRDGRGGRDHGRLARRPARRARPALVRLDRAIAAWLNVPFVALFLQRNPPPLRSRATRRTSSPRLYTGPLYAMNQGLAEPRMRATAVALHLLVVGIVGGGVSPGSWVTVRRVRASGRTALRPALLSCLRELGARGPRYLCREPAGCATIFFRGAIS
jgi:hypothetical protein